MRIGVSYKINAFIFVSILLTTLSLSFYFYKVLTDENRSHSIQILLTSVHAVKNILEPKDLLKYNAKTYQTKDYKKEWDKLKDLQENFSLRYIYVLLLDENKKLFYIFDTGDNPEVISFKNPDNTYTFKYAEWVDLKEKTTPPIDEPGDGYFKIYTDAPKEAYLAIEANEMRIANEYTDRWGTFLSAFLPIIYKGQVVGLIGADYEISYIKALEKQTLYVVISVILFALFLNLIIGVLLRQIFIKPIVSLAESSKLIAEGNLNTEIKMQRGLFKDEVTDLFQNFSFMSFKLFENFSRIENYSKEIERLSKTKDEFLANLSHEIKTPLTIVFAYAEMLAMNEDYPEEVKNYSQEIYSSAQKLNDYVSDVILVTDIESNIKLEKTLVDIRSLLSGTLKQLKPLIEEKEIQLELILADDLQCNCDNILLEKAMVAIIKNAIVYNKQSGKVIVETRHASVSSVSVSLRPEIQITITDTGIGIAKEFLEKVFEKFFRIDSALTYEVSGVGVGLFIAKKIIELHEGTISIDSEFEQGTKVTVTLPLNY